MAFKSLQSYENGWWNALILKKSIFTLDYEPASTPVPEPATMTLIGAGLLSLVGMGRKRYIKKR